MKCGSCKRNDDDVTVQHVRQCYGVAVIDGEEHELYQVAPNAVNLKPLSEKQYNYINTLRIERGEKPFLGGYEEVSESMTLTQAKAEVTRLKAISKTGDASALDALIAQIPEGRFGVSSLSGKNDIDFYKVEKPSEGEWAGWIFVRMIVGGKPDYNIKGRRRHDVLKVIAETGWETAAQIFASQMGQCWMCGISLTKYASRQLGQGYICSCKRGQGDEWLAIQTQWESEQAAGESAETDQATPSLGRADAHPIRINPARVRPASKDVESTV
jgi:hypothetical protein